MVGHSAEQLAATLSPGMVTGHALHYTETTMHQQYYVSQLGKTLFGRLYETLTAMHTMEGLERTPSNGHAIVLMMASGKPVGVGVTPSVTALTVWLTLQVGLCSVCVQQGAELGQIACSSKCTTLASC